MPLSGRTLTLATALTALLGLGTAGQRAPDGWQLPQNAETEANPLPATDDVLDRGRRIYESKCWRCHGPLGKGDGPEADPDRKPGDLSDPARASRNPDGIIFYKVWNGRRSPDMPAFKSELEPDDVWAVVHYVKTLRRRASFISKPVRAGDRSGGQLTLGLPDSSDSWRHSAGQSPVVPTPVPSNTPESPAFRSVHGTVQSGLRVGTNLRGYACPTHAIHGSPLASRYVLHDDGRRPSR